MGREKDAPFKLYNKRYVPLFAIFFILGIYAVKLSAAVSAILLACAALFLFLLVRTKSLKTNEAIALGAFAILGFCLAFASITLYNETGPTGDREISCRAIEVSVSDSDGSDVYFVVADSIKCGGKARSGKIKFQTTTEIKEGDRVRVYGTISINALSLDKVSSAMQYRVGNKYSMRDAYVLDVKRGAAPLARVIRKKALEVLVRNQGERAGAFVYATLFGDHSEMLATDKAAMREIGVAHVFAVSGLHVGVLSAVLIFLLKKLRAKGKVIFFAVLPVLGFYAYLCGFTPSVLRASIMVLLSLAASAIGMRYDSLSSISFAAIAILLFKPLYLFDLSFIMSFLSVLGILSLARPLEKAFVRGKMRRSFASALSISLSTTIALAPVSAVVFGKISFLGIALNLVVVPLASVTYVLSILSLLLTFLYSGFGEMLSVLSALPTFIAELSVRASAMGKAQSYAFSAFEIAVYYATLAFVGHYSLANRRAKAIAAGSVSALMLALIFA